MKNPLRFHVEFYGVDGKFLVFGEIERSSWKEVMPHLCEFS